MPPTTKRSTKKIEAEVESVAVEAVPDEGSSGAVVAQDEPVQAVVDDSPFVEEQWLSLNCRHGEVAPIRANSRGYFGGELYFCRRCGTNRFVRQVLLTQPYVS